MIKACELRGVSQVEFPGNWALIQRLTNRKLIRNCVVEGKGSERKGGKKNWAEGENKAQCSFHTVLNPGISGKGA